MDMANNPELGTGSSHDDVVQNIEALLDSDNATTEILDADETEIVSNTVEDDTESELEGSDQTDEDEDGNEEDGESEAEATPLDIPDDATVVIDGNTVTGLELKNGYLRQADYTRKSQELSQARKEVDAQRVDVHGLHAQQKQHLDEFGRALAFEFQSIVEPDWNDLATNDPAEFVKQRASWDKKQMLVKMHSDAMIDLQKREAEFHQQELEKNQRNALELLSERYQEFREEKTRNVVLGEIEGYLSNHGFSQDDIGSIANGEIIDIVYKALKYDQQQINVQKAVKHVESKPPLTTTGGSKSSKSTSDNQRLQNNFTKTGSLEDAQALISKLMN